MRLLIIEDDPDIARTLSAALKAANYAVDTAADGDKGYFMAATNAYDLIVLDYNLPSLSGRDVIEKLRADGKTTPILMLTVHSELSDKVDILTAGADDYLTKPFALSELLARIRAILRRPESWQSRILKAGDLEIDPDKFIATRNGRRIVLSSKEFSLLEFLLQNKGRVMSRQEIMEHVWDENANPFSNTIEAHISNLRKKIETGNRKIIYTVSNRGYKIDEKE